MLADTLSGIPTPAFYLENILAFYLAYILAYTPAFYLAHILALYPAYILALAYCFVRFQSEIIFGTSSGVSGPYSGNLSGVWQ